MIKVCHVTSAHPQEDVRIFRKECTSLARAGYDVTLVQQGESYEKDGVHISGFGERESNRVKRMLLTARRAYRTALAVDADLYHIHDPELLPYGLKLKKKGKKVIFDSHEKYAQQILHKPYLPGWCSSIISKCYALYEGYVLRRIDGLIFPCLQNGVHPFEGQCRRIETVDNVPMLEELYDRYDPSVEKIDRSIVHIGSLTHTRGITHMVRATEKVDCRAYLGGVFSPASYQQELEKLPGYANVEYLGHLDREQVLRALQTCQIGMATLLNVGQYNQFDNLATKIYEYMSLALPVVLSRSDYNEKVTARYGFGICVDPADPEEIAGAVRYLLEHPEEAKRMGENGRKAVKEVFNWTAEEKKLLAMYHDILNN